MNKCNIDIIKYLTSLDLIDITSTDNYGRNILHYLCQNVSYEEAIYIISLNQIDVTSVDNDGKNILHYA